MSNRLPKQTQRVLGTLVLGLVVFWSTLASSTFQTWLAQRTLNKLTLHLDLVWHVEKAAIGLFPPAIEGNGIQVSTPSGDSIHLSKIRIASHGWRPILSDGHIDSIAVQGVKGRLSPQAFGGSAKTPANEATPFSIDHVCIEEIAVTWAEESSPTQFNCGRFSGQQIEWNGTHATGMAEARDTEVLPLANGADQMWSMPWEESTVIQNCHLQITADSIQTTWDIDLQSNWGAATVALQRSGTENNVLFDWKPTPVDWPVDHNQPWVEPLNDVLTGENITGNIAWNTSEAITGQFSGMGLELPLALQQESWSIGPVDVHMSLLETVFNGNTVSLPAYLTSSPVWETVLSHDAKGYHATAVATDAPQQSMALDWNGDVNEALVNARVDGMGIQLDGMDVVPGMWELAIQGQVGANGLDGTVDAHHPGGSEIDSQWELSFNDSAWEFSSLTQLIELKPSSASSDWAMHGELNWRASGIGASEWTQIAEMRNIILLENGAPRTIERFDKIQSKRGENWSLDWDSYFTAGKLRCNTSLLNDWTLDPRTASLVPRNHRIVSTPRFEGAVTVMDWAPVALMADLPFDAPQLVRAEAAWEGNTGTLNVDVPEVVMSQATASGLQLSGRFGEVETPGLGWHADSLEFADGSIARQLGGTVRPIDNNLQFTVRPFSSIVRDQEIELKQPVVLSANPADGSIAGSSFTLHTPHGQLDCGGKFEDLTHWNFSTQWHVDSLAWPVQNDSISLVQAGGEVQIRADGGAPLLTAQCSVEDISWHEHSLHGLELFANGPAHAFEVYASGQVDSTGSIEVSTQADLADMASTELTMRFAGLPLRAANPFFPPSSIALEGQANGAITAVGLHKNTSLTGVLIAENASIEVPYLGTTYGLTGSVDVRPDGFYLDQWELKDRNARSGTFNGTALHDSFSDWSLDFGIELPEDAVELMNIPPTPDALFYGQATGTGDINVSGHGPYLQIDAAITSGAGTDFALPMDGRSDVNYAEFIRFADNEEQTEQGRPSRGVFSDVTLNLGIDVDKGAQARIVFDRDVGDEIVGEATGHLDLTIDDFEELSMTGDLEITEGAYYFTLQNWLNKRFDIQPGSTIAWQGDPYNAELSVATTYTTRTTLDALLPEVSDLPGRLPIELGLKLDGSMLQPKLDFGIEAPTADSRVQALMEGALISEEEVQRQALGILVMGQFLPSDPAEAAVGGFIQPAQSTQFLANQLGHWISQIAPAVDVGLDYAQDALSGEQALGLALSTQMLNDRLHIEGEFGAQSFGQVHAEDVQIQDLTVSFDLTPDGNVQLTGHTRQNANLTSAIEGQSVQGVGLRFRWAFDRWRDLSAD